MPKETSEILRAIHDEIAQDLLRRIQSGQATAAELREARQFLKDNGIDCIPTEASPLLKLADSMPNFTEDEAEEVA